MWIWALMQFVGFGVGILAGLALGLWALFVLFVIFGPLGVIFVLILGPLTILASVLIVWFDSGAFPVIALLLYLGMWGGLIIGGIGSSLTDHS